VLPSFARNANGPSRVCFNPNIVGYKSPLSIYGSGRGACKARASNEIPHKHVTEERKSTEAKLGSDPNRKCEESRRRRIQRFGHLRDSLRPRDYRARYFRASFARERKLGDNEGNSWPEGNIFHQRRINGTKERPPPPPPAGTNVGLVKNFRNSLLADVFLRVVPICRAVIRIARDSTSRSRALPSGVPREIR